MTYHPDDFENQLRQMVKATCGYEKCSLSRQQGLTKIFCFMQDKIWRGGGDVSRELYEVAFQETCLYFCRHLCDLNTIKQDFFRTVGVLLCQKSDFLFIFIYAYLLLLLYKPKQTFYNPLRGSPLTWFNNKLKWKIKDLQIPPNIQTLSPQIDPQTGEVIDPIDNLPAPPINTNSMIDEIQQWLEENQYRLRRIHLRDRPEINSYVVITRYGLGETTWGALAQEFAVPMATIANFYQRKCLPLLQEWSKSHGYLED